MTTDARAAGSFAGYFSRSLTLYAENFLVLMNFSFACAAPMILRSLMDAADETGMSPAGLLLSPIIYCVNTFFLMSLTHMVALLATGERPTAREAMAHAWGKLLRGLGGYLILTLAAMAGFLLLILPGVYCVTTFSFFIFAILLEDEGVIGAFKRSLALVHPRFWRVLGANALVLLVTAVIFIPIIQGMSMMQLDNMLISVIGGVVAALLMPVFVGFYYCLFEDLKTAHDGTLNIAVRS